MPSSSRRSTSKKKPGKPAKAAKAKAKVRAKVKGPAKAKKPAGGNGTLDTFAQAVSLVSQGFIFDAVKKFEEIVKDDRGNDLADDALVNAGLCYMHMSLYRDAIAQFTRVIQGYPDATIAAVFGGKEVGRTAAKALYCRLKCHLVLGDTGAASADLENLKNYPESHVVDDHGQKKTFYDLANEAFAGQQSP